jgi:hypothetical protein
MSEIRAFCIPGKHEGPSCGTTEDGGTTPPGWHMIRVSLAPDDSGTWIYDESSPSAIICCPQHLPLMTPHPVPEYVPKRYW